MYVLEDDTDPTWPIMEWTLLLYRVGDDGTKTAVAYFRATERAAAELTVEALNVQRSQP